MDLASALKELHENKTTPWIVDRRPLNKLRSRIPNMDARYLILRSIDKAYIEALNKDFSNTYFGGLPISSQRPWAKISLMNPHPLDRDF